ncbi:MAG: adenylate/guanylate cyclase domain-containing protein [Akkermansiaceae bacterium]
MPKIRLISLRLSIGAAFALTVITTTALIGISTFFASHALIREGIRQRLQNIATLAVAQLDTAAHARIRTRADQDSPDYALIKRYLNEVKSVSPDIRFVYTYRINEAGKVIFVVDAESAASAEMSNVGDEYTEAPALLRSVYNRTSRAAVGEDFVADKWGLWLSGFAPVLNAAGEVECAVGIDISAQVVRDYERGFLVTTVGLSAAISIIALLASVWYSRLISRPLLALADELARVERLDLDRRIEIRSAVREVVVMGKAVQSLQSGLRSFRKYVPADLVAELMALGQEARLSAEKREITVFFSDMVDFTTLAEKTTPERLVEHLAPYFDGMTRSIIENQGTVDKYIGDSIMAFWGAPRPMVNHATLACRAALQCRDHSRRIGEAHLRAGQMPMFTRIGLNTGPAIIGNIGYEARLNYTAMGDTVNLGSRLEGLNRVYGTDIILSESTWQLARENFEARLLDVVAVKGKSIPVRIYELLGEKGSLDPARTCFVADYEQALGCYLARQFAEGAERFSQLMELDPTDQASALLHLRCQHYLVQPPPATWQGEYVLDHK